MIRLLCTVLFLLLPAPAPAADPPASPAAAADEKVLKALDAWLKAYRSGKIEFNRKGITLKDSIAEKFGLLPKSMLGELTRERELDILLEQAAKLDSAEALLLVLEVAAVGLDQGKYTREMAPFQVRAAGERCLAAFTAPAAKDQLLRAARGELKGEKARQVAVRAASLRGLGSSSDGPAREVLEQALAAPELQVRLAAADGLARRGDESSVPQLAATLEREAQDAVIEGLVGAIRACYAKYLAATPAKAGDQPPPAPPEGARLAVRAAIGALGRGGWRADMALVGFLEDFRSADTIPALIEILQRFKDHPDDVVAGKLSGLLLHRAHEALVSLTGAVFPADRPDQWRELWEREKATIKVSQTRPPAKQDEKTVSQGFCGIPVQGTRVVFVLDLSGSMNFSMKANINTAAEVPDKLPSRLDFAKRELLRALDDLPEQSSFNLVSFNGEAKARTWSKDLQQATAKNKDRFRQFVQELKADGGTNLWAGMQEGLKLKSLVYGDRYESNIDEVFLLSDGAPTVGEVLDPQEILRLVAETNRFSRVRINTVFITTPTEPLPPTMTIKPEELMHRMAEQNGGRFVAL